MVIGQQPVILSQVHALLIARLIGPVWGVDIEQVELSAGDVSAKWALIKAHADTFDFAKSLFRHDLQFRTEKCQFQTEKCHSLELRNVSFKLRNVTV